MTAANMNHGACSFRAVFAVPWSCHVAGMAHGSKVTQLLWKRSGAVVGRAGVRMFKGKHFNKKYCMR